VVSSTGLAAGQFEAQHIIHCGYSGIKEAPPYDS